MRERPIIMSGESVRAILDGRKTQTRRVVWPQPEFAQVHKWNSVVVRDCESRGWVWKQHDFGDGDAANANPGHEMLQLCPYGAPGDRLWVKETFTEAHPCQIASGRYSIPGRAGIPGNQTRLGGCEVRYRVVYRADGEIPPIWRPTSPEAPYFTTNPDEARPSNVKLWPRGEGFPWFPSVHMRRDLSRLALEVAEVRVQRLQDITEEDARAEGVPEEALVIKGALKIGDENPKPSETHVFSPTYKFAILWNRINAARGFPWASNPWVWAVTFRRVGDA